MLLERCSFCEFLIFGREAFGIDLLRSLIRQYFLNPCQYQNSFLLKSHQGCHLSFEKQFLILFHFFVQASGGRAGAPSTHARSLARALSLSLSPALSTALIEHPTKTHTLTHAHKHTPQYTPPCVCGMCDTYIPHKRRQYTPPSQSGLGNWWPLVPPPGSFSNLSGDPPFPPL